MKIRSQRSLFFWETRCVVKPGNCYPAILLHSARMPPGNPSTFREHFKKALEAIPDVRVLTPHSCRHTYVSQMQALGVDLATIQSIVGHADVDMTQHYLHVQERIRQDAIARFSKAFTSEPTDPDKPTDGACKVLKFPKVG